MTTDFPHRHSIDLCAQAILKAFDEYLNKFKEITIRAKHRFENRDWHGMKSDAAARLDLYKNVVDETSLEIKQLLKKQVGHKTIWANLKTIYQDLCGQLDDWELAETFFNSITRRIFATVGVDPKIEFVDTCSRSRPVMISHPPYRTYTNTRSTAVLMEALFDDYKHQVAYEDMRRDARLVAEKLDNYVIERGSSSSRIERVEMLNAVFYRTKGAYLVGRFYIDSELCPIVLALLNTPKGIVVDAVLTTENEVSVLFSFTRSYFHVDVKKPTELISFLKSIMPRKRIAELYISIGYNKHGKSEMYCDLLQHLSRSEKKFEIAKGARGMVMEVFTMPDYDLVFKVIKDHFAYPKNTTRKTVMEKYSLVFKHDRVGRLVDAQEFEHLKFSRNRFADDLLESLQRVAVKNVILKDDHVIVRHAYVERRVIPLNIYLPEVDDARAQKAVVDFGNAIKDLAANNIFPGDLLLKNFGVTRHGRVVFYDYDELCLLSICNFRAMPTARSYEDELSREPWFAVGENDVFPEEFRTFLGLQGTLREVFEKHHGDLFEVHFWKQIQSRLTAGESIDILPYEQRKRLAGSKQ